VGGGFSTWALGNVAARPFLKSEVFQSVSAGLAALVEIGKKDRPARIQVRTTGTPRGFLVNFAGRTGDIGLAGFLLSNAAKGVSP